MSVRQLVDDRVIDGTYVFGHPNIEGESCGDDDMFVLARGCGGATAARLSANRRPCWTTSYRVSSRRTPPAPSTASCWTGAATESTPRPGRRLLAIRSERLERGRPYDDFVAEWSTRRPPEEALRYYGATRSAAGRRPADLPGRRNVMCVPRPRRRCWPLTRWRSLTRIGTCISDRIARAGLAGAVRGRAPPPAPTSPRMPCVIGEGATAMTLDLVCTPWDHDAGSPACRACSIRTTPATASPWTGPRGRRLAGRPPAAARSSASCPVRCGLQRRCDGRPRPRCAGRAGRGLRLRRRSRAPAVPARRGRGRRAGTHRRIRVGPRRGGGGAHGDRAARPPLRSVRHPRRAGRRGAGGRSRLRAVGRADGSSGGLVLVSAASLRAGTARGRSTARRARSRTTYPPTCRPMAMREVAGGAGRLTCSPSGSTWAARSRTAT